MISARTLSLVGSEALFVGVSLLLLRFAPAAPALFPFYGALLLWSDLRRDAEAPVIFLFLIVTAGAVLAARAATPAVQLALGGEIAAVLALSWAASLYRGRDFARRRAHAVERAELEQQMRDDDRDLKYYQTYEKQAGGQISLRRDLTESARALGATMDRREVHERLVAILSARFPQARVVVTADPASDPAIEWSLRKKAPLLVKDAATDERLREGGRPSYQSCVVVPLKVLQQPAGFVKLESDQPGAFSPDDVKSVDLVATMAAMSLENIQFYEQVHEQATHDALTQLVSHRTFQQRLQDEILRAGRSQTPMSVIMCDVDHFKRYNDGFGHQAGDHLLRTLAGVLSSFARPVDVVARYGGEEFAFILPSIVRSEAVQLAERVRQRVAAEPFVFQGQNTGVTMSFGVASFPQDATTASQIMRAADERLYRAKESGRNRVVG